MMFRVTAATEKSSSEFGRIASAYVGKVNASPFCVANHAFIRCFVVGTIKYLEGQAIIEFASTDLCLYERIDFKPLIDLLINPTVDEFPDYMNTLPG